MATVKQRLCRKNGSGEYDTVHLETSSEVVRRPGGESVETALASLAGSIGSVGTSKSNKCKVITINLPAGGWSDGIQAVSNADFVAGGYVFVVSAAPSSIEAYGAAGVYASAVNINGRLVFHCSNTPESSLTVTAIRYEAESDQANVSQVINATGTGGGGGRVLRLVKIEVTRLPNTTQYAIGDTFDPTGMVVLATYGYGDTVITDTIPNEQLDYTRSQLTPSMNSITLNYSEDGVTKSAVVNITVSKRVIPIPVQQSVPSYTGSPQAPDFGSQFAAAVANGYVNKVSGSISETNDGTYSVTYRLTDTANCEWAGGGVGDQVASWKINPATITSVPTQSNSLSYTGSALAPEWNGFTGVSDARMEIDSSRSVVSSTNAGTFNVVFKAKPHYAWKNGDAYVTEKMVSWTISKIAGSLSIDQTSKTFTSTTESLTVNVTRAGDGAITAESSNNAVATASVSGTKVTIRPAGGNGSATITIKVAAGTNHTAPANKTVSITASVCPASSTVGQTFTFNGTQWMTVHVESDKIYACTVDCVTDHTVYFRQAGGSNAYAGSDLAAKAMEYQNTMSASDLAKLASVTVNGVTAKVFAPSYEQMNGGFSYFSSNANRIAKYNGIAKYYWTSSPYPGYSDVAYGVDTDGSIYNVSVNGASAFRPFVAFTR